LRPYQVEGEIHMADVLFPKRTPTPRELDTRPIPSDYRPKKARLIDSGDMEGESYGGDELRDQDCPVASMEFAAQVSLHKLEDELSRNRLNEIATLMRTLTYGEMMELAHAIWKIRPEGEEVDQYSLPMMLHLWSTSPEN